MANSHAVQKNELNLTAHRASGNVWNRRGWDGTTEFAITRWLIGVGGGALAIQGMRRRGFVGPLFAAVGSGLAWWALTGKCDLEEGRRRLGEWFRHAPWRHPDPVHEASDESFPASDPPARTATVGTGLSHRPRGSTERGTLGQPTVRPAY
jgi:hypothetical protein